MKRTILRKPNFFLIIAVISVIVALTFSVSMAKLAKRYEYKLQLAMVEHFAFSAGTSHTFEIPRDGYYSFRLWGADGGDSKNVWSNGADIYTLGGKGAEISAVAYFTKGTVLIIVVGTRGDIVDTGYNGGGWGGTDLAPIFNNYYGGGGGGATDIRLASETLEDRILVAGGGGGGSGGSLAAFGTGSPPSPGGNGGSAAGGYIGENGQGTGYGEGGSLTAGGEGYDSGSLGRGGDGNYSGGGGGGGYYGGGGSYGSSGGGGGGSSYIGDEFTTDVPNGLPDRSAYITDIRDGYAIISYLGTRR